ASPGLMVAETATGHILTVNLLDDESISIDIESGLLHLITTLKNRTLTSVLIHQDTVIHQISDVLDEPHPVHELATFLNRGHDALFERALHAITVSL
ncbi:MAG: hypothetical protein OWS74_02375, partial [Firmicutes bacterium]|nr:hypothetical protein [Bacillota bacterium]